MRRIALLIGFLLSAGLAGDSFATPALPCHTPALHLFYQAEMRGCCDGGDCCPVVPQSVWYDAKHRLWFRIEGVNLTPDGLTARYTVSRGWHICVDRVQDGHGGYVPWRIRCLGEEAGA